LAGKNNSKKLPFRGVLQPGNQIQSLRFQIILVGALLLMPLFCFSQSKPDTGKVPIEILPGTALLQYHQTDSGALNKLIGNVSLKQGETLMYCDSAYFFADKNNVEAFGNVRVIQPGSEAQSDYMRYNGSTKMAYMKGNVMLTDGKSNLWSEEVDYNVSTKIGTYTQGGTLQDSTTTLSSNSGVYNMQSKDARFTNEVYVTDPQYNIESDDMGYNTNTKLVTFFNRSVITSGSSVLHTTCGTYDSKNEIARFNCRSSVINEEHYVEADNLDHNRKTGIGNATGNVIAIDTSHHTTLYGGRVDYNEKRKTTLASIKPVLKQMNGKDSLFIRADTFYSAPIPRPEDTVKIIKTVGKGKKKKQVVIIPADTTEVDSNRLRYFIGYHHVLLFADSMQGRCDSISYSQQDSIIRMIYDPIAWSRKSQITGDTILLYTDSGGLKKAFVPNNATVVSLSATEKAGLYDQVQGKTLTALIKDNAVDHMIVQPNAETIYYTKDDDGAYIGVNEATSNRMRIYFKDQQISRILFEQDVKQQLTPLDQANIPALKLSRFQWLDAKRPKSLEELFK
jgi:lipopolysaccharide export system protein LptA